MPERLLEIALFLAPFAAYLFWRRTLARGRQPSRLQLLSILAGLAAIGGGLAWFGTHGGGAPGARYVPAQFRNGQVVPGHEG